MGVAAPASRATTTTPVGAPARVPVFVLEPSRPDARPARQDADQEDAEHPGVRPGGLATRRAAALRFFRERRIIVHYVDLRKKPIAAGELRRFIDKLGAAALLDTESRAYREQGLAYLSTERRASTARLLADVRLLNLPLVRYGEMSPPARPRRLEGLAREAG